MTADLETGFRQYAEAHARRVLTHLDRDPDSPTYGCFDRDHWHYKIRDFPSSILQQGVVLLEALGARRFSIGVEPRLAREWTLASINALARQTRRSGAVDEYYPGEDSYPASAFALWAVARVLFDWKREHENGLLDRVEWGSLARLRRRLAARIEIEAGNQYAAGVAALALCATLPELGKHASGLDEHASRLFSLQHSEGWFAEYGGPDFGYLSVTLDTLADYYDATGDGRAVEATDRAVEFLASLVGPDGQLPWTLNSRNTDYAVPYGLARAAGANSRAAWLVETLFAGLGCSKHSLWATDDRYHLHYIYASVVRSLPYLKGMSASEAPAQLSSAWFPGCGFWMVRSADGKHALYAAGRKGGLLRLHSAGGATALDHGWRICSGGNIFTNNWWSSGWKVTQSGDSLTVEGTMQTCRFHPSTPWRHLVLRLLARLLGRRLAPVLKSAMIFRRGKNLGPEFRREITVDESGFTVRDTLGRMPGAKAVAGPRQNLRHVASADSFHVEEWIQPLLGAKPLDLTEGGERTMSRSWSEFGE